MVYSFVHWLGLPAWYLLRDEAILNIQIFLFLRSLLGSLSMWLGLFEDSELDHGFVLCLLFLLFLSFFVKLKFCERCIFFGLRWVNLCHKVDGVCTVELNVFNWKLKWVDSWAPSTALKRLICIRKNYVRYFICGNDWVGWNCRVIRLCFILLIWIFRRNLVLIETYLSVRWSHQFLRGPLGELLEAFHQALRDFSLISVFGGFQTQVYIRDQYGTLLGTLHSEDISSLSFIVRDARVSFLFEYFFQICERLPHAITLCSCKFCSNHLIFYY